MQRITCSLLAATLLFLGTAASSKEEAEAVDPKYTWDLTEIYPTIEAWEQARDEAMQDFEKLEERRGTLGGNADSLFRQTMFAEFELALYAAAERDCA